MNDILEIKETNWNHIEYLIRLCEQCKFPDRLYDKYMIEINSINLDDLDSHDQFLSIYYNLIDVIPEPIQSGRNYNMRDIKNKLDKIDIQKDK